MCDYFEKVWLKKTATNGTFIGSSIGRQMRNGALRHSGFTLLYQFLHKLQYQQIVRTLQLGFGSKARPVNTKYAKMNERLYNLWTVYEQETRSAKHDTSLLPTTFTFLRKTEEKENTARQIQKIKRMRKIVENAEKKKSKKSQKLDEVAAPSHQANPREVNDPQSFLTVIGNGHCFYGSVALIIYRDETQQARVRQELMNYFSINCKEKWTRWICPADEVEDYIQLRRTTPDETFCSKEHWGRSQELILAARLYQRNFVLFKPQEKWKFINFSAEYEGIHTPLVADLQTSIIRYKSDNFDVVRQEMKE